MELPLVIELVRVPAIFILGSLFHFIYKYAGKKKWMAIISPVNESIWEHLKIAFYPALLFTLFQMLVLKDLRANFLTAELIGIYSMLLFILIAEFIYPSILKKNVLAIDLSVFFLAIVTSQVVSCFVITNQQQIIIPDSYIALVLVIQVIIFTLFSFRPPRIPLFKDSVDDKYGIK